MNESLRKQVLDFFKTLRVGTGRYRYSLSVAEPTLYSSTYAAMARHLLGDPLDEAEEWAAYLLAHQDEDGLFRDPVFFGGGHFRGDPLWCGWPHLTLHVVTALACLGAVPEPITWLEPFLDASYLTDWLAERDWKERVSWTGNEIMNVGVLLQYEREVHGSPKAAKAVKVLLDWFDATDHLHSATGLWGELDASDPIRRSHLVQAAYHIWPLYTFDDRPILYLEAAIDQVLLTQNERGGFGCGVHNPGSPLDSSACEDIDSIEPLVRFSRWTDYRHNDIFDALRRAELWVRANQSKAGGFVFIRGIDYEYGHPQLFAEAGQGAAFPTWFRLLSLAYIEKALGNEGWQFTNCPGMQFWR